MGLPRNEQGPAASLVSTSLRQSPEDNGVSGQQVLDLLSWRVTSFSGVSQRPTALHRSNRASALTSCATSPQLPTRRPTARSSLCSRWWSETEGLDTGEGDVKSLAAVACIGIKLHSARYSHPAPFCFQTFGSRPAPSLTFSRLLPPSRAGALTRDHQNSNVPSIRVYHRQHSGLGMCQGTPNSNTINELKVHLHARYLGVVLDSGVTIAFPSGPEKQLSHHGAAGR